MVERHNIDDDILKLKKDILSMAALCEKAIEENSLLVENKSSDNSKIRELKEQIEVSNSDFETSCMRFLLRRHPVARDFRSITACLRTIGDLERIGTDCLELSETIISVKDSTVLIDIGIPAMLKDVSIMLKDALNAFIARDKDKAEAVIKADDQLDELFTEAKKAISNIIDNNLDGIKESPDALLSAKYLERMGDHAVNIAKHIFWSVSGEKSLL